MLRVFKDRHDAGAQLAQALHGYAEAADVVVLAHTRTSVPVAYEVATRLALPLEILAEPARPTFARGTRVERYPVEPEARPDVHVADKIALLVDDGDTVRHMAMAIEKLRALGATSIVAASAVAAPHVYAILLAVADHVAIVLTPQHLYSIEAWYADLSEPSDDEISAMLVAATQNLLLLRRSNLLAPHVDS